MWDTLKRLFDFFSADVVADQLQIGIDGWNKAVQSVFNLLNINPTDFKEGVPWAYIEKWNVYFSIIAASLLAVIMLYRFCAETADIRQELRGEHISKMLITFILAEAVVVNSLRITTALFSIAGAICSSMSETWQPMIAPENLTTMNIGLVEGIVSIVAIISFYVLAAMLLYAVYFRFLKLYLIVPLAPIAYATFAGTHELSRTGVSYLKTLIAFTFEIVIIGLAINIGNLMASMEIGIFPEGGAWLILEPVFTAGLVVGSVKGAEGILRRTFAL